MKLRLKRVGGEEFKAESQELIHQVDEELAVLDPMLKSDKTKVTGLKKDKAILEQRLAKTDTVLASICGQLTEDEARVLILKKLYDLVNTELNRYLNTEKRKLVQVTEKLWDKYAVPIRIMEEERTKNLAYLGEQLSMLGYSNE